ncbi:uncharacterized protein EHS24_003198 [Apiotrichum porosum]|uniref:Uncharacterized protein n=1 Tax=Apiotrichum porosum TaxID=105984 RepID=A0A427XFM8_9TREE|nr:uncharacterized protein EHS24_003198 [Apiotrichum porosum]RSH77638.1 hypothetical protein EHS24_003198 [Apiotrichum porosum]
MTANPANTSDPAVFDGWTNDRKFWDGRGHVNIIHVAAGDAAAVNNTIYWDPAVKVHSIPTRTVAAYIVAVLERLGCTAAEVSKIIAILKSTTLRTTIVHKAMAALARYRNAGHGNMFPTSVQWPAITDEWPDPAQSESPLDVDIVPFDDDEVATVNDVLERCIKDEDIWTITPYGRSSFSQAIQERADQDVATLDPSTFQRLQEEDNRLQEFPLDIKDFDDVYRLSEALLDVDSGRHTRLDGAEMRLTETLRFIVVIRGQIRVAAGEFEFKQTIFPKP